MYLTKTFKKNYEIYMCVFLKGMSIYILSVEAYILELINPVIKKIYAGVVANFEKKKKKS